MLCGAMCFPTWGTPPALPPVPVDVHWAHHAHFTEQQNPCTHAATRPTKTANNKYLGACLNSAPCTSDTCQVYQQVCKMISRKNNSRKYLFSLEKIIYNIILKIKIYSKLSGEAFNLSCFNIWRCYTIQKLH